MKTKLAIFTAALHWLNGRDFFWPVDDETIQPKNGHRIIALLVGALSVLFVWWLRY